MEAVNKAEEIVDLPPGFRFHPTDEEIITYYLTEKVMNNQFSAAAIGEADLNKCEPWDLHVKAKMGVNEWYFFCQKDRKYPTGMRTNRATEAGYWKATGKDKEIYRGKGYLVGMKKTLVFYKGRAPKGEKTNWVMHEFRLEGNLPFHTFSRSAKDEWVVCRVYHKPIGTKKNPIEDHHILRMNSFDDIENLLDYSSLPPLMDPSSSGRPGSSSSAGDRVAFKPVKAPPPPPPPQLMTMNQNYIHHPNTNLPQNTVTSAAMFNPQVEFQNPISSFGGAIRGSGFGYMGPKSHEVLYKVEQVSPTQSGLSADANYHTTEISSKQHNMFGSSKSYEDFAYLGNIWDY